MDEARRATGGGAAPAGRRRVARTAREAASQTRPGWPRAAARQCSCAWQPLSALAAAKGLARPNWLPPLRRAPHTYRLLGVAEEASFDEIQDARNYLYEVSAIRDL